MKAFSTAAKLIVMLYLLMGCSGQRAFRKGMEAVERGEYYQTTEKLRKAYSKAKDQKSRAQISFELAEAYRKMSNYNRAATWYKNAIRRGYPNEELKLLAADAFCGAQKHREGKELYEAYLQEHPDNEYAQIRLAYCDSIQIWQDSPSRYEVSMLKYINSRGSDYAAFYSSNRGNEILFSSMREDDSVKKGKSKITGERISQLYKSTFDLQRNRWMPAELLVDDGAINTPDDNGAATLSPTGDLLLFTRCATSMEHNMGASVFSSSINRGKFAHAERLELAPDSLIAAHPYFSASGDTLFFASDRPGGLGGTDIWMSIRAEGVFSEPINLGAPINTRGNEVFPTTDAEGNLYFSSNYHPSLGGYDIYCARQDAKGTWQIKHMPIPINSMGDDLSLTFLSGSEYPQGLLTSNRKGSKSDDIYAFSLPPLVFEMQGMIYNKSTNEPLDGARVRVIATDGTDLRVRATEGQFKVKLKPENEYVFAAYKDYFLNDKIKLSTVGLQHSEDFTGNLYLTPIDRPIAVSNISYEYGSSDLTKESKQSLNAVVEMLQANPNITIELMAHTDHVGSAQSNSLLSQNRAQSVVNYLITLGISNSRLMAKGYGETSPKQISAEEANQYDFLKKGDVLTESFINKLTPEQQDIAKSLNRRTEFRVISTDYHEQD
ncbi:MAG: OmpA family protein [Mangrovibacterium sp.]